MEDGAAAWSPSGRRITFQATRYFEDPAAEEGETAAESIWTVRSDGPHARRLRDGHQPAWISGGRRIAFLDSQDRYVERILSMRADGSHLRVLLGGSQGYRTGLVASPDGCQLLFIEDSVDTQDVLAVRILNLRSGRVRTIPAEKTWPLTTATWSPNATRVAFAPGPQAVLNGASVFTIKPNGTGRRSLCALRRGPPSTCRGSHAWPLGRQPRRRKCGEVSRAAPPAAWRDPAEACARTRSRPAAR